MLIDCRLNDSDFQFQVSWKLQKRGSRGFRWFFMASLGFQECFRGVLKIYKGFEKNSGVFRKIRELLRQLHGFSERVQSCSAFQVISGICPLLNPWNLIKTTGTLLKLPPTVWTFLIPHQMPLKTPDTLMKPSETRWSTQERPWTPPHGTPMRPLEPLGTFMKPTGTPLKPLERFWNPVKPCNVPEIPRNALQPPGTLLKRP